MRLVIVGLLLTSGTVIADPKPAKPRAAAKPALPCPILFEPMPRLDFDLEARKLARLSDKPVQVDAELEGCWAPEDKFGGYRIDLVENLIAAPVSGRSSTRSYKKSPVRSAPGK